MVQKENQQLFWSEQARQEFDALFDDKEYSDHFRWSVAKVLATGWGNNKDKPFWILAHIIAAIGSLKTSEFKEEPKEASSGLEIVWLSPGVLLEMFQQLGNGHTIEGLICEKTDVFILLPQGKIKITRSRLAILQKVSEFLLACDGFEISVRVTEIFEKLARTSLKDGEEIALNARKLAQLAYRYRSKHFKDANAASGFSQIKLFLTKRKDFEIDDAAVLTFWMWPENEYFKTYAKVFYAFADFYEAVQEANAGFAVANASSIHEPAISNQIDAYEVAEYSATDEACDDVIEILSGKELKLFKHSELKSLSDLFSVREFGLLHSHSALRLFAFQFVQSAISNSLRTGKSKIPLSKRVECEEATSYQDLVSAHANLEKKLTDWLKVALYLRGYDKNQVQVDEGKLILKRARLKSLQRPVDELQLAFGELEASLIAALEKLRLFDKYISLCFGEFCAHKLSRVFHEDKNIFTAAFRKNYLE